VSEGLLITTRNAEFRTFNEASKRLQMNARAYSTGYHLLISILEVRIDADADLVENVAKQIAALSKEISVDGQVDKRDITRINSLQEQTMSIRENIFDRQRILSGIQRSERFPNDIYPRIQLMMRDVSSLISHADFSFERLDYLQDTALGLITIEQNNTSKVFTLASVVFLPATLVASVYGMNFKWLPFLDLDYGWLIAMGMIVGFSALTYLLFKRIK
jgi:magnesium transporter